MTREKALELELKREKELRQAAEIEIEYLKDRIKHIREEIIECVVKIIEEQIDLILRRWSK